MIKEFLMFPRNIYININTHRDHIAIKKAEKLKGVYFDLSKYEDRTKLKAYIFWNKPFSKPIIINNCLLNYKEYSIFAELAYNNNFDFYLLGTPIEPWDFENNAFHKRLLDNFPEQFI